MTMTIVTIAEATDTLVKALQTHAYQDVAFSEHGTEATDADTAQENADDAKDCATALTVLIGHNAANLALQNAYQRAEILVNGN